MKLEDLVPTIARELLSTYSADNNDSPAQILTHLPDPAKVIIAQHRLLDVFLPGKIGNEPRSYDVLEGYLNEKLTSVFQVLEPEIVKALPFRWQGAAAKVEGKREEMDVEAIAKELLATFFSRLIDVRKLLVADVKAAYEGDPAALTFAEVQLAYPGLIAVAWHRIAHELYLLNVPIIPRIMSEYAHSVTGADIHPGATIGKAFFVDHATGVVIGETAEIGFNVKIYQGVTLGAKSFPLDEQGNPIKRIKRHPTVEDGVVIYANSTILGGDTVIGKGSTIAGNVFLTHSVPAGSFVSHGKREVVVKPSN